MNNISVSMKALGLQFLGRNRGYGGGFEGEMKKWQESPRVDDGFTPPENDADGGGRRSDKGFAFVLFG